MNRTRITVAARSALIDAVGRSNKFNGKVDMITNGIQGFRLLPDEYDR